jgi:hypothetical protein
MKILSRHYLYLLGIMIFGMIDGCLTLILFHRRTDIQIELNPLMGYLLPMGGAVFLTVKMLILLVCVLVLFKNFNRLIAKRLIHVSSLFLPLFLIYVGVVVYEVLMLGGII